MFKWLDKLFSKKTVAPKIIPKLIDERLAEQIEQINNGSYVNNISDENYLIGDYTYLAKLYITRYCNSLTELVSIHENDYNYFRSRIRNVLTINNPMLISNINSIFRTIDKQRLEYTEVRGRSGIGHVLGDLRLLTDLNTEVHADTLHGLSSRPPLERHEDLIDDSPLETIRSAWSQTLNPIGRSLDVISDIPGGSRQEALDNIRENLAQPQIMGNYMGIEPQNITKILFTYKDKHITIWSKKDE